jgi:malate synthase
MWAMPDLMAAMLEQKIAHPKAGANTAWVPSPTAATLHATHYHKVNVAACPAGPEGSPRAKLSDILSVPVAVKPNWTPGEIQRELDNNAQGILGYVVRWVDQGVGCSKVPDINNVGSWKTAPRCVSRRSTWPTGCITRWSPNSDRRDDEADGRGRRSAELPLIPLYQPMAADFEGSIAFQAALDLVLKGRHSRTATPSRSCTAGAWSSRRSRTPADKPQDTKSRRNAGSGGLFIPNFRSSFTG